MSSLYNISIYFYLVAIYIASLFNIKAKLWVKGRKDIFQKITKATKGQKDIVWFHCASLGEFEQGKPIIEAYRLKYPQHKILLTFFSPSGFEIRKNTSLADFIFYLPIDTKVNAKKFISTIKPIKAIFIKYEFWFNYMIELKKQNIPFYSVSTIFQKNQTFFKYKWFAKQLRNVNHFFVQDKTSAELLKSIAFTNVTISGDSRFDTVFTNSKHTKELPIIKLFTQNKTTIICGSTWPKDENILMEYINKNSDKNYIIAPHELNNIKSLQKQTNALLYSNTNKENIFKSNVLIIDSIGLLSHIYKYGNIAYIGGGFGAGIHNILEAVTFGLPVVFGPNYKKFKEANDIISLEGGKSINNITELKEAFNQFNNFDNSIARKYIKDNCGASSLIVDRI